MTAPDDLTPQQRALYDDLRDHMLANAEANGVDDDPAFNYTVAELLPGWIRDTAQPDQEGPRPATDGCDPDQPAAPAERYTTEEIGEHDGPVRSNTSTMTRTSSLRSFCAARSSLAAAGSSSALGSGWSCEAGHRETSASARAPRPCPTPRCGRRTSAACPAGAPGLRSSPWACSARNVQTGTACSPRRAGG